MRKSGIAIGLLAALLLGGCGRDQAVFKQQSSQDPLDFKAAYEALNDEVDENGKPKYDLVDIPEDNNIVILTYDEMMQFFDSGSGVLYVGRPGCPWCRKLLPALLAFAEEQRINIYYYDIQEIRDDNGPPYQALLAKLDPWLPVDTVTQSEDDPDFNPELKRVVVPQLFFVAKGQVAADWLGYEDPDLEAGDQERALARLRQLYAETDGN